MILAVRLLMIEKRFWRQKICYHLIFMEKVLENLEKKNPLKKGSK